MGLLALLNLPSPPVPSGNPRKSAHAPSSIARSARSGDKAAPAKARAPNSRQVEVVEEGGATWDDREVSEEEAAAFIAGGSEPANQDGKPEGTAPNGGAPKGDPSKPAKPPPDASEQPGGNDKVTPAISLPVSLTIKIGKRFKYVEIESLKIVGELKATRQGDTGIVQVTGGGDVKLGKKVAPATKVEVDLVALKELLLGDLSRESAASDWDVDAKLEFKVSSEDANVALGISVANGWYTGSTKFIAVAKEKGKDFEFASFNVSPIGYQVPSRKVELGGSTFVVTGKITVVIVLKPAWSAIAADLAAKVGRRVLTAVAEAATVEAAVIAGFAAGAAAQIFALVKSTLEWQDVKACAKAAEDGWLSFLSGFCSVYGVKWGDGGVAALRGAGIEAGAAHQQARLMASREQAMAEGKKLPADFNEEYLRVLKESVTPDGVAGWVEKNFRSRVIEGFLKAYENEHRDDYMFKTNFRALKTMLGARS